MRMSKTITDAFEPYIGTTEYHGIVADIQRWFYGDLVKASWCATSVSFFANQVGVLSQLGGKNENVYRMMKAAEGTGKGTFLYRKDIPNGYVIKRGTVIFMLKSDPPMTETSAKHVTTAYEDITYRGSGNMRCLGGNQSDSIKVSQYSQTTIYAIFLPDYEKDPTPDKPTHPTLRKGDKGTNVKKMQSDLRKLGFAIVTGKELLADGSYGPITTATVTAFQVITNCCRPDGICGPLTWAKIDELLAMPKEKTVALTDVYLRSGPGPKYKNLGIVAEGKAVTYTTMVDGWIYIPSLKGWSRSAYYDILPMVEYAP